MNATSYFFRMVLFQIFEDQNWSLIVKRLKKKIIYISNSKIKKFRQRC